MVTKKDLKYKECRNCGSFIMLDLNDNTETCLICNSPLYETNYKIDFTNGINPVSQKRDFDKELYNLYVKNNPENYKYYIMKIEHEKKIQEKMDAILYGDKPRQSQPQNNHTPKCPTCGSTNINKISGGNKVGSAALFGLFSLGHISKTFKCGDCGMKF